MIIERLSESTRRELEALSFKDRWTLTEEMRQELPPGTDPVVREFFETLRVRPLIDPEADPVALVHEGRRA